MGGKVLTQWCSPLYIVCFGQHVGSYNSQGKESDKECGGDTSGALLIGRDFKHQHTVRCELNPPIRRTLGSRRDKRSHLLDQGLVAKS